MAQYGLLQGGNMKCLVCDKDYEIGDILLVSEVDPTAEPVAVCKFCAHEPNIYLQVIKYDKDNIPIELPRVKPWSINSNVLLK